MKKLILFFSLCLPSFISKADTRCKDVPNVNATRSKNILLWVNKCKYNWVVSQNISDDISYYLSKVNKNRVPLEHESSYESNRSYFHTPVFFMPNYGPYWNRPYEIWIPNKNASPNDVACGEGPIKQGYIEMDTCVAGCFEGTTQIAFPPEDILADSQLKFNFFELSSFSKWLPIVDAFKNAQQVIALAEGSSLDDFKFSSESIGKWITDRVPVEQDMVEVKTASGITLHITPDHPLLADDGRIVGAGSLINGTKLMHMEGFADEVISIRPYTYFGKVYNLDTKRDDMAGKMILANGIVSGTHHFQDAGQKLMDKVVLWKNINNSL